MVSFGSSTPKLAFFTAQLAVVFLAHISLLPFLFSCFVAKYQFSIIWEYNDDRRIILLDSIIRTLGMGEALAKRCVIGGSPDWDWIQGKVEREVVVANAEMM